jgi:hypothetical protein
VVASPLPGVGRRMPEVEPIKAWHATLFHTPLVENAFDAKPGAIVRCWTPTRPSVEAARDDQGRLLLNHTVETYVAPGAFTAGIS